MLAKQTYVFRDLRDDIAELRETREKIFAHHSDLGDKD